jgi:hypothetical protein
LLEDESPFPKDSMKLIADLKWIYKLDLDARASHRMVEE